MTSGVAGNNLISIHAPARGATSMAAMGTTLGNGFQSTLPRGERLVKPCCLKYPFNFNPRSREGSDEDVTTKVDSLEISIHAPARGATSTYQHTHYSTRISIHAPARGATDFSDFFKFFLRISIHAPARGATVDPFFGSLDHVISIHAPARGATFCRCFLQLFSSISIHAPARGATIPLLFLFFPSMHFNPRSREGSDYKTAA